jgi:hypothetical protein
MKPEFTTIISADLVDALDEAFSPIDGIVAIDQITLELPQLHRTARADFLKQRIGFKRKVYHGRYDWYPLGFSYMQVGTELHVIDLWPVDETGEEPHRKFDIVLGIEDGEFTQNYELNAYGENAHE